jgi:hypothetical protein
MKYLDTLPPYNAEYDTKRFEAAWSQLGHIIRGLELDKYDDRLFQKTNSGVSTGIFYGANTSGLSWQFDVDNGKKDLRILRSWSPDGKRYGITVLDDQAWLTTDYRLAERDAHFSDSTNAAKLKRWCEIDAFHEGIGMVYNYLTKAQ